MKSLFLFDIDGTLVNINDIHLQSYKSDYLSILKIKVPDEVILKTFGMSDSDMRKSVFKDLRMAYNANLSSKIRKIHLSNFVGILKNIKKIESMQGVLDFLSYLKTNKEYLGVISGNSEQPAGLILEKSRLLKFFPIQSFDDGKSNRKQILQRAINKAKNLGCDFKKIIVIGDTLFDIEAGKSVKAFTVGVATGSCKLADLKKTADIAVASLKDYRLILNAIEK